MIKHLIALLIAFALATPMSVAHAGMSGVDMAAMDGMERMHGSTETDHNHDHQKQSAEHDGHASDDQPSMCHCIAASCATGLIGALTDAGERIDYAVARFVADAGIATAGLAFAADPPPPRA